MLIIQRNGKTTVLTGWRAWLAGAVALLVTWMVLAGIAVLVIGIGLTVGTLLLLAIPAIVGVGLIASAFNRRR